MGRRRMRRIVVDGVTYNWGLSPDSGHTELVLQRASGPGQRLIVNLGDAYRLHPHEEPGTVTPSMVRSVILCALERRLASGDQFASILRFGHSEMRWANQTA